MYHILSLQFCKSRQSEQSLWIVWSGLGRTRFFWYSAVVIVVVVGRRVAAINFLERVVVWFGLCCWSFPLVSRKLFRSHLDIFRIREFCDDFPWTEIHWLRFRIQELFSAAVNWVKTICVILHKQSFRRSDS
jgi:hypothetical protein